MNLEQELLRRPSKERLNHLAQIFTKNEAEFSELISCIDPKQPDDNVKNYGAWLLSTCADHDSSVVVPYLDRLTEILENTELTGVRRNIVRVLSKVDLPEELHGRLADICFSLLASRKEPVAVRVFSMIVLHNLCGKYPEMARELCLIIKEDIENGSPGFKSRGRKVLKDLESK